MPHCGARCLIRGTSCGRNNGSRQSLAAMRKVWRELTGSKPRASENSDSAARRMLALGASMGRPASVGTMPAPERTKSGSPASSRSFLSDALTAGWYLPRRMAAFETLRSVNTVCKTLIKWRSILSKRA